MAGDWTGSTAGTCSISGLVWYVWNTATNAASTSIAWPTWCETMMSSTSTSGVIDGTPYRESAKEREAREKRQRKEAEEHKVAEEKATQLLREHLDEEQRKEHAERKRFFVVSQSGERYEVDCQKRQHNVYRVDAAGKRLIEYCIYQKGELPLPDNALAQKLLLEHNEREFVRIANARQLATAG